MQNKKIEFANTLRGFAALSVIVSHYYGVFWSSRAAVEALTNSPALPLETHPIPHYISWLHFFPLFNWGAYGVALFFIISGFVIPFSLQKMSWISFLVNRVLRIMPIYIIGFSITLFAIFVSGRWFLREWPFSLGEVLIHYIPGVRDILWSRDIDGIVWTLEIEIKFYILCAILIGFFRLQSLKVFIASIVLLVFAIFLNQIIPVWANTNPSAWKLAMVYITISQYIIYMFIGVVFHYLYREKLNANKAYLGIGCLFAVFCIHWSSGPYTASLGVAWSYGFALLTFSFAYTFPTLFKSNRLVDFFANISYPLYVIHGVAGYVLLRIMLDAGFKTWISLLIVTFGSFLLSYVLHRLVERPMQKISKNMAFKF